MTIGTSWGYNRKETEKHCKTAKELICKLGTSRRFTDMIVEVVALGGNFLLNIYER